MGGGDKKSEYDFIKTYFSAAFSKGVAIINVNYRLAHADSDGEFPNSVIDIQKILDAIESGGATCNDSCLFSRTALSKVEKYAQAGIVVAGGSSGGYLAVMGAGRYLVDRGANTSTNLKCINNNVGPMDLREYKKYTSNSQTMISAYARGDLSKIKLETMSPAYLADTGVLTGVAKKVTWILNYNRSDNVVPPDLQAGFTAKLRSLGTKVILNVANDPIIGDPNIPNHNLSDATIRTWMSQLLQTCLGV